MWIQEFDPAQRTVWIEVQLWGPSANRWYSFVLDTGSPVTVVDSDVADELGYSAMMGKGIHRFWSVGGPQYGYVLEMQQIEMLGAILRPCEVICQQLPRALGVDGLIGVDLLVGRRILLDFAVGRIEVHG